MPLFQSESKCETIFMKMTLTLHEEETACRSHFYMKGFALRPVLKQNTRELRNGLFHPNLFSVISLDLDKSFSHPNSTRKETSIT